jgi:hypothetical protein
MAKRSIASRRRASVNPVRSWSFATEVIIERLPGLPQGHSLSLSDRVGPPDLMVKTPPLNVVNNMQRYQGVAGQLASRFKHRGASAEDLRQVALLALGLPVRKLSPGDT